MRKPRSTERERTDDTLRLGAPRGVRAQLAEMRPRAWTFRCDYRLHIGFFRAEFAPRKNNAQKQMRKPRSTERTDDNITAERDAGRERTTGFSHGVFPGGVRTKKKQCAKTNAETTLDGARADRRYITSERDAGRAQLAEMRFLAWTFRCDYRLLSGGIRRKH